MNSDKIVLIGMMAAGKTTLGVLLAQRLGRRFLDADSVIEDEAGTSIADMFRIHGEAEFRRRELATLRRLAALPEAAVIAAGGGAFCQEETRALLRSTCDSVFLKVPEDELLRRLEAAGVRERPLLLSSRDWRERVLELARARYPLYAEAAYTIEVRNEPPETTVERLAAMLGPSQVGFGMVSQNGFKGQALTETENQSVSGAENARAPGGRHADTGR